MLKYLDLCLKICLRVSVCPSLKNIANNAEILYNPKLKKHKKLSDNPYL